MSERWMATFFGVFTLLVAVFVLVLTMWLMKLTNRWSNWLLWVHRSKPTSGSKER